MEKKKWSDLWLAYDMVTELGGKRSLTIEGFDSGNRVIKSAIAELNSGLKGLVGIELVTAEAFEKAANEKISFVKETSVPKEGYEVSGTDGEVIIKAGDENGILYGVFALLRNLAMGQRLESVNEKSSPSNPIRMMNHWDDMDGKIERG